MKHAFITCLPRSRSAHTSCVLTHDRSFMFHDVFDGLETWGDFVRLMSFGDGNYDVVGAVDPALVFCWKKVHAGFPNAKWVVIERNIGSVATSIEKFNVGIDSVIDARNRLVELTAKLQPLVVNFDELNPATLRRIATYLEIDIGSSQRVEQLCKMNIQIEHSYMRERIAWNASNPSHLLREIAA